jgi:orotate phosphoribosyltransferase
MTRAELAAAIHAAAYLEGQFKLRSGRVASHYFDKYRFESDPTLLRAIAEAMQDRVPADTEALAGLELGGVPIATQLSQVTGLPCLFVRKQAKEYGTCQLAEGGTIEGRRLLIVEDVVTSGGQVGLSAADLRSRGARVEQALCVIDREEGGTEKLAAQGIELLSLFRASELGR